MPKNVIDRHQVQLVTDRQGMEIARMARSMGIPRDRLQEEGLGKDGAIVRTLRSLRGSWREENGVIYLRVTSGNVTGPQWVKQAERNSFYFTDDSKAVHRSPHFRPTNGVNYEIAILKGGIFKDRRKYLATRHIFNEAKSRGWMAGKEVSPEVADLIRASFSAEDIRDMGLYHIVVMHRPICGWDGHPCLLAISSEAKSNCWLHALYSKPTCGWGCCRGLGFAFVSQIINKK